LRREAVDAADPGLAAGVVAGTIDAYAAGGQLGG
jgi:hypothetical protein